MHKKLEINRTKIKGDCQSGRKVVPHDSKSDLPLQSTYLHFNLKFLLCFFQDSVITSYRAHGFTYVMGVPVLGVLSELTGRSSGCVRGKGKKIKKKSKNLKNSKNSTNSKNSKIQKIQKNQKNQKISKISKILKFQKISKILFFF